MKKSAFTLIELSIVLVIIGLLIGGSFKILKVMRERAQISRAQDDVQVAKQAIIGNSIINDNTLPDQDFFKKNLSPIKNNQHQIFYAYDTNLTATNICSFKKTGLTVTKYKWNDDKSGEEEDKVIENVAFVIVSESQNHNMQTALKDGNVKFHAPFYKVDDNTTPINKVEGYDDIVNWVTLPQLQQEARCQDKPFRIINRTLPIADINQSYNATLYVENNISNINMTCTPKLKNEYNITFDSKTFSFSGDVNKTGTPKIICVAKENSTDRNDTKSYVITINNR